MNKFIVQLHGNSLLMIIQDEQTQIKSNGLLTSLSSNNTKIVSKPIVTETILEQTSPTAPASLYSVYVTRFNNLEADDVKEVFEKEFGPVVKVRPFCGHCFVDFKEERAMTMALTKSKINVKGHELGISVAQKKATKR